MTKKYFLYSVLLSEVFIFAGCWHLDIDVFLL